MFNNSVSRYFTNTAFFLIPEQKLFQRWIIMQMKLGESQRKLLKQITLLCFKEHLRIMILKNETYLIMCYVIIFCPAYPKTGNLRTFASSPTTRGYLISCLRCFLTAALAQHDRSWLTKALLTQWHGHPRRRQMLLTLFPHAWITFT